MIVNEAELKLIEEMHPPNRTNGRLSARAILDLVETIRALREMLVKIQNECGYLIPNVVAWEIRDLLVETE
jgi:hypothetical protein